MIAASAPRPGLVCCSSCSTQIPGPWVEGVENAVACPSCQQELRISVFPPIHLPASDASVGKHALEGEATCFFHPEKRAERTCDRCGRFLCALCDLPVGSRHLCPSCLKAGDRDKPLPELVSSRISWGQLSLLLVIIPVLVWPMAFVTAPAAVFLAIRGWNRPGSLVHGKRRFSAILAIFLGLVEIGLLGFLVYLAWKGATHRVR